MCVIELCLTVDKSPTCSKFQADRITVLSMEMGKLDRAASLSKL